MAIKCPKCQAENTADSKLCKEGTTPLPFSEEIPISPIKTLETPKEELSTGSTFAGRYQIIEEFGPGGMKKEIKHKRIRCFGQRMEPIEQTHYGSSP